MGSPVEDTIRLCLWARLYHKFGYPTSENVWSCAVAIVPTRPQLLLKPGETALEVGQAEASRTPMKNGNALEPTKTDQGKQRYIKPTTLRRLTGTVLWVRERGKGS